MFRMCPLHSTVVARATALAYEGTLMAARGNAEVTRYLRAKIPEWYGIDTSLEVGQRPAAGLISVREAAKVIGVTATTLGDLLREKQTAGQLIEDLIAEKRFRGDVTKLRQEARKWCADHPDGAPTSTQSRMLSAVEDAITSSPKTTSRKRTRAGR